MATKLHGFSIFSKMHTRLIAVVSVKMFDPKISKQNLDVFAQLSSYLNESVLSQALFSAQKAFAIESAFSRKCKICRKALKNVTNCKNSDRYFSTRLLDCFLRSISTSYSKNLSNYTSAYCFLEQIQKNKVQGRGSYVSYLRRDAIKAKGFVLPQREDLFLQSGTLKWYREKSALFSSSAGGISRCAAEVFYLASAKLLFKLFAIFNVC